MKQRQQQRFSDAPWLPREGESVMVGGAGGIGSWLTLFLSRIGFEVYLYDFDTIEDHNLGGQLFRLKDVNSLKVDAIKNIVQEFCDTEVITYNEEITKQSMSHHYCFSAFDNMKARRTMFESWKELIQDAPEGTTPIFIDGRLEIEHLQIFCVTPKNADRYERFLFSDDAVQDAPCSMKQSSHTAAMIGSLMAAFFTNHITNEYSGEEMREVPFFYEYMVPMNFTVTEI